MLSTFVFLLRIKKKLNCACGALSAVTYVRVSGNGEVSFDEFVNLMARKLATVDMEEEILEAFRVFDSDGNGSISREELRVAIATLGTPVNDQEVDELMAMADADADGHIDYTGIEIILQLSMMSK